MNFNHLIDKELSIELGLEKLQWEPKKIESYIQNKLELIEASIKLLLEYPKEKRNYSEFIIQYESIIQYSEWSLKPLFFLRFVSPVKEIREISLNGEQDFMSLMIKIEMNRKLYHLILESINNTKLKELSCLENRLISKILKNFERNGINLPDIQFNKLKANKNQISKLCSKFTQNLIEFKEKLQFSEEELKGIPISILEMLDKNYGHYHVPVDYPILFPFLKTVYSEEARKKMYTLYLNRGGDTNHNILSEILNVRHENAIILGYSHHLDYSTEKNMIKKGKYAIEFINNLSQFLQLKLINDINSIKKLKYGTETIEKPVMIYDYI